MNEQPPSLSEWSNLYDAALKFKELELLEPIAAGLGIELIMVRELPAIEEAEGFMTESFGMLE